MLSIKKLLSTLFVVLMVNLASCSFITFEQLKVDTNLGEYGSILAEGPIEITFSDRPVHKYLEDSFKLTDAGVVTEVTYKWVGSKVFIEPVTGWNKGNLYNAVFDGKIELENGRQYTTGFDKWFYYGSDNNYLEVVSYTENNAIEITFNKPVNTVSFMNGFSVTPAIETTFLFSADLKNVTVKPTKPWSNNQRYTWSLTNIRAQDGYPLKPFEDKSFYTPEYSSFPEVTKICKAYENDDGTYLVLDSITLDSHISGKEPFAIIFSQPMDFFSVKNAIGFYPALEGELEPDSLVSDTFIYKPTNPYKNGENYCLTIAASAENEHGIHMREKFQEFFSIPEDYLEITQVIMSFNDVNDIDQTIELNKYDSTKRNEDELFTHVSLGGEGEITFTIHFSTEISRENLNSAVEMISFGVTYPAKANTPTLVSAKWLPSYNTVALTYNNLSISNNTNPYYYCLSVNGGEQGLTNGFLQFMKQTEEWYLCIDRI